MTYGNFERNHLQMADPTFSYLEKNVYTVIRWSWMDSRVTGNHSAERKSTATSVPLRNKVSKAFYQRLYHKFDCICLLTMLNLVL